MAYWREYRSKKTGALLNRALVYTAKDRAIQAARRESRYGIPAWRDLRFQHTRESYRIPFIPDARIVQESFLDACNHLAAYRARYHANLRVKYGKADPQFTIRTNGITVGNAALSLDLDQAAINETLRELRYLTMIARAYHIDID